MSEEGIVAMRGLFAAFKRRDLDAVAGFLDPALEIRPAVVGGPEGVVYRGPEGMRRFWSEIDSAWEEFELSPEEFRSLDGGVLVLGRVMARGKASGIKLDAEAAWLARISDGKLVDFRSFTSQDEALEAAERE